MSLMRLTVVLACLAPLSALAAAPATSVSETAVQTPSSPLSAEKFYVNYFGNFHGASFDDLTSPYTPTVAGKPNLGFPLYFDSNITAGYRVAPKIIIGPELNFFFFPVMGKGFTLNDTGLKIYNKSLINLGGANIGGSLILQATTSDYSRDRGQTFAVKLTPFIRYAVPNSSFTVGAWTEAKSYMGVTKGKTFKLWGAPYVNYALASNFSLNLQYESEYDHFKNDPNTKFKNSNSDLQPGFIWNITKDIMINPYIMLYTGSGVTLQNTSVNALISATVL